MWKALSPFCLQFIIYNDIMQPILAKQLQLYHTVLLCIVSRVMGSEVQRKMLKSVLLAAKFLLTYITRSSTDNIG